jgi:hypothetical protein
MKKKEGEFHGKRSVTVQLRRILEYHIQHNIIEDIVYNRDIVPVYNRVFNYILNVYLAGGVLLKVFNPLEPSKVKIQLVIQLRRFIALVFNTS